MLRYTHTHACTLFLVYFSVLSNESVDGVTTTNCAVSHSSWRWIFYWFEWILGYLESAKFTEFFFLLHLEGISLDCLKNTNNNNQQQKIPTQKKKTNTKFTENQFSKKSLIFHLFFYLLLFIHSVWYSIIANWTNKTSFDKTFIRKSKTNSNIE